MRLDKDDPFTDEVQTRNLTYGGKRISPEDIAWAIAFIHNAPPMEFSPPAGYPLVIHWLRVVVVLDRLNWAAMALPPTVALGDADMAQDLILSADTTLVLRLLDPYLHITDHDLQGAGFMDKLMTWDMAYESATLAANQLQAQGDGEVTGLGPRVRYLVRSANKGGMRRNITLAAAAIEELLHARPDGQGFIILSDKDAEWWLPAIGEPSGSSKHGAMCRRMLDAVCFTSVLMTMATELSVSQNIKPSNLLLLSRQMGMARSEFTLKGELRCWKMISRVVGTEGTSLKNWFIPQDTSLPPAEDEYFKPGQSYSDPPKCPLMFAGSP